MLDKVLTLLAAVAELLRRWRRLREQTQHEQQQDAIQENPGAWLDSHFNGTPAGNGGADGNSSDRLQQPASVPDNASDAGNAEAAGNDGTR